MLRLPEGWKVSAGEERRQGDQGLKQESRVARCEDHARGGPAEHSAAVKELGLGEGIKVLDTHMIADQDGRPGDLEDELGEE